MLRVPWQPGGWGKCVQSSAQALGENVGGTQRRRKEPKDDV